MFGLKQKNFFNSQKLSIHAQWLLPVVCSIGLCVYLFQQAVPSGVNGYFYLKQIQYFFETGQLYFQDRSLAFALPFVLRRIFSSELLAYHSSVALMLMGLCVLQARMAVRLSEGLLKSSFWIVSLCVLLFFTHPHVLFFGLNFYKNLFAITFLLFGVDQYFLWMSSSRRRYLLLSILAFCVAILAHKSSLVLCGLWLGAAFLFHSRKNKKLLLLLPFLLIVLLAAFLLYFPKATAYVSFLKSGFRFSTDYVLWLKSQTRLGNFIFGGYLTLLAVAGYLVASWKGRQTPMQVYTVWMFCVLLFALLPIHSIGQNQLGYRWLLLSLTISLPLVVAVCVRYRFIGGILLGLHLGQWMYAIPLHRYFLDFHKHEQDFQKITQYVDKDDYLIAHHGLEFYIDHLTGIRARIFLPEQPPQGGDVYRIVHVPFGNLRWQPLRMAVNQRALLRITQEYFLMKEDKWLEARKAALFPPESWQNPMEKNPGHVYQ